MNPTASLRLSSRPAPLGAGRVLLLPLLLAAAVSVGCQTAQPVNPAPVVTVAAQPRSITGPVSK